MFIEVNKIIEAYESNRGIKVLDPRTGKPSVKGYTFKKETIRLDEIKSCRHWDKNEFQEGKLIGDVSLIYLVGDKSKESTAQMLVMESYESLSKRLKSTPLEEDGKKD